MTSAKNNAAAPVGLLQGMADAINRGWPTPRLRVRSNTMTRGEIAVAVREAATLPHGCGWSASHGGGVANAYRYPAETECTAVQALRGADNTIRVEAAIGRRPANKVTQASAMQVLTGTGRGPWWTFAGGRTPSTLPTEVDSGDDGATYRYRVALDGSVLLREHGGSGTDVIRSARQSGLRINPRVAARLLRKRGHDAHLDRQKRVMIGQGDDEYHLSLNYEYHYDSVAQIVARVASEAAQAESGIAKRRVERRLVARNAEIDRILSTRIVWVSAGDSVSAGNCPLGTSEFRARMERELGAQAEIGAVTASAILAVRDDAYTRRACRVAALRLGL